MVRWATLSKKFDGYPFVSITPYLVDHDGSLLILISSLAEHTKNIRHDPRIQTQGRATVVGNPQMEQDRERVGLRYLRYFPEAQAYFAMHDFSFYRILPVAIRCICGFGKIHLVNMENYAVAQAEAFAKQEAALLAKTNTRQQVVLQKLLREHHGADEAEVQAIGLDCDGSEVRSGEQIWKLNFPEAASGPSPGALTP